MANGFDEMSMMWKFECRSGTNLYVVYFLDPELMLDQSFAKDRQKKDNHNMSEYLILIFFCKPMLEVHIYISGYHNKVVPWLMAVLVFS